MKQLYLGGARSGKSRLAQAYALNWQQKTAGEVMVIATAEAGDSHMVERIAHHKQHRPTNWVTCECSLELGAIVEQHAAADRLLLVDCLTLWTCNEMLVGDDWPQAKKQFIQAVEQLKTPALFISNEVGQGVVPLGEFNRRFVDELGWLNQAVASCCDQVVYSVAGLPMVIKAESQ